jgi:hypothetical protein
MVVIEHSSAAAFRLQQQQQAALPNSITITSSSGYTTDSCSCLPWET